MKTKKHLQFRSSIAAALVVLAALFPRLASANLIGPYTLDTNTLILLHFDQSAGTTVVTNPGTFGHNFISTKSVTANNAGTINLLGGTGYSTNSPTAIAFGGCMTNVNGNSYGFGCDYNNDGIFDNSTDYSDFVPLSALNMGGTNNLGTGTNSPWTIEMLVQPFQAPLPTSLEFLASMESSGTGTRRGLQWRLSTSGGITSINFIAVDATGSTSDTTSGTIPSTGPDAVVANAWYHTAVTYDGTNVTLYWTRVDPNNGAAHVIAQTPFALGASWGGNSSTLVIGNYGRSGGDSFDGAIDEVRFSSVCRAANQMQFWSPAVNITSQPFSVQNVDYNGIANFSVAAATTGSTLAYQWRFNSNNITGATNTTYTVQNVAAFNAGYYDCVVTNTLGYSNITIEAKLVVGAANFLSHRYSFTADDTDSIGGANGTNFGDAYISGGQLVLDGVNAYAQFPPSLYTGTTATALTVEFWATFGASLGSDWVFLFNGSYDGAAPVDFFGLRFDGSGSPEIQAGRSLQVDETLDSGVFLAGQTMHIAYTWDPPNQTIAIYTNGFLAAIDTNATVALADVPDGLSFLGYLGTGSGYLNASFDEFRIYNGALNTLSLQQSDNLGPNQVLADGPVKFSTQPASTDVAIGNTATFTATAVGYLPIFYQWFTNGVPVPGATNVSFSFVPTLGDNNDQVVCYATNTIGATTYSTNTVTATLLVVNPTTVIWTANSSDVWDTTTPNWSPGGPGSGFVAYGPLDSVIFDDEFNAAGTVDLALAVNPQSITLNSVGTYDFISSNQRGSLTGPGTLTLNNTGTLILDVTNNLTGGVTISSGTLQIGNGDTFGTLGNNLQVTDDGTLTFDRSDTINVVNVISGSGGVNYNGPGTVNMTAQNTYSGTTILTNGTVHLGAPENANTGGPLGEGSTILLNGGWLQYSAINQYDYSGRFSNAGGQAFNVDTAGQNVTWANGLGGASSLTKIGLGSLTLSGGNNYTGNTVISNGTLQAVSLAGNVSVASGATLVAGTSNTVATLSVGGNLNLTGSALVFDITNLANASTIQVTGNLNPTGVNTVVLSNTNPIANGIYPLLTVSGTLGGTAANFTVASQSPKTYTIAYVPGTPNQVVLQVTGPILSYSWIGNGGYPLNGGNNYWDINTSTNWGETGGTATPTYVFTNGYPVVFDDTAAIYSINIASAVAPASVVVNSANTYTFSGPGGISGATALTMIGTGNLTINTVNSYTGPTTITNGVVTVSADNNLGADPVTATPGNVVLNGGTLQASTGFTLNAKRGIAVGPTNGSGIGTIDVPTGQTLTYGGVIANNGSGTGGLTLTDLGTLALSGTNTYTGATTVSSGELDVSNWGATTLGTINVGTTAGITGTLGITGGTLNLGGNNVYVSNDGGTGIVNQLGGTVTFAAGGSALLVGNGSGSSSTGTYNLSGGTLSESFASATRGVMIGVNSGNTGNFNLSGSGVLNMPAAELAVGRDDEGATDCTVAFDQTGGTATVGYLSIGGQAASTGTTATFNLTNGTFVATNFQDLAAAANSSASIYLGGGAQVTLPAFPAPAGTVNLTFDFTTGYLSAFASSTNYLSGLTAAYLTTNGAKFNVGSGFGITVAQVLQDLTAGGTLTKSGAGSLTLTGANTYTGITTLSNGVINLGSAENAGSSGPLGKQAANASGTILMAGGTLQYSAVNANDYSGRFGSAGHQAFNVDVNGQAVTFATPLTSSGGSLTLNDSTGGGTLALSTASAYTGNTTVSGGTLVLNYATLATNSAVSVSNGVLNLNFSVTNPVAALVLNGVSQGPGLYNSGNSAPYLSGAGSLLVTGPGIFTNYTGIISFRLNGANIVLTATNGQAGDAYYLLRSTNLALPLSQWTVAATNVLGNSGTYTFTGTNVVVPGLQQQFFRLSNTNF